MNPKRNFFNRYITIFINGSDFYTENIPTDGEMKEHLPLLNKRIADAAKALPAAKFSGNIEQQWYEGYGCNQRHIFQILDSKTGSVEEKAY
jgi:uncharacterized protein YodC (DUF2158 family)